jgi:hypothetical protein
MISHCDIGHNPEGSSPLNFLPGEENMHVADYIAIGFLFASMLGAGAMALHKGR